MITSKNILRNKKTSFISEYKKNHSCLCCGESDNSCLDFHHKNTVEKSFNIGRDGRDRSILRIMLEIDKCIILCSNCHRKIHYYGFINTLDKKRIIL